VAIFDTDENKYTEKLERKTRLKEKRFSLAQSDKSRATPLVQTAVMRSGFL